MDALVAKLIKSADAPKIPAVAKAVQKEWDRLWKAKAWVKESVCEYESARSAANRDSREVHFGRVFPLCRQKDSESAEATYKGRVVLQGNNVRDQSATAAVFQKIRSSAALVEASKCVDIFSQLPGHEGQQSDAVMACIQALLGGVETWVELPKDQWCPEWTSASGLS
jgi:hypothetical protein